MPLSYITQAQWPASFKIPLFKNSHDLKASISISPVNLPSKIFAIARIRPHLLQKMISV